MGPVDQVEEPALVRRQLGRHLRRLRLAAGKTHADAETAGMGHRSTLWRIEAGRAKVRPSTVRALCWLYDADDATSDALYAMARRGRAAGLVGGVSRRPADLVHPLRRAGGGGPADQHLPAERRRRPAADPRLRARPLRRRVSPDRLAEERRAAGRDPPAAPAASCSTGRIPLRLHRGAVRVGAAACRRRARRPRRPARAPARA